jgi:hypothetical protein
VGIKLGFCRNDVFISFARERQMGRFLFKDFDNIMDRYYKNGRFIKVSYYGLEKKRDRLMDLGKKGESYDQIINRLTCG